MRAVFSLSPILSLSFYQFILPEIAERFMERTYGQEKELERRGILAASQIIPRENSVGREIAKYFVKYRY